MINFYSVRESRWIYFHRYKVNDCGNGEMSYFPSCCSVSGYSKISK